MAIFDKELDHIDPQNVPGSLRMLESYIAYMRERLEFNNTNLTKTLSANGTSSAEMVLVVAALKNSVQALQSSVAGMDGQLSALQSTATELQSDVTTLQTSLKAMQQTISSLNTRVTALENPQTEGST